MPLNPLKGTFKIAHFMGVEIQLSLKPPVGGWGHKLTEFHRGFIIIGMF
jgi:hypothetical protein